MKKSLKQKLLLLLIATSTNAISKEEFTDIELNKSTSPYIASDYINHVYFSSYSRSGSSFRKMSIVMENSFEPCPDAPDPKPDTRWAEIREEIVGKDDFEMLSSVVLSTLLADKKSSLKRDRDVCMGSRANIVALKLNRH